MEYSQLLKPVGVNPKGPWCCPALHPVWMSARVMTIGSCSALSVGLATIIYKQNQLPEYSRLNHNTN